MSGSPDRSINAFQESGPCLDRSNELIDRYKEDCEIRGISSETTRRYLSSLGIFNQYLQQRSLDILFVDKDAIKGFLNYIRLERKVSRKTIENYFSALSSFYEFMEYEGYVDKNPIISVRKRYIRSYKDNDEGQMRKLISTEEMTKLINSVLDVRDKAIITLLAKTGIRRHELLELDVDDIDWPNQEIRLKPTPKRTNRIIFFDDETAIILHRWIKARESRNRNNLKALFISNEGGRLSRNSIYRVVIKAAIKVELHDPKSEKAEDRFGPHCCRHWFTTHLRRAGMSREFIQELRGDVRKEAIDIYDHIDKKELKESYLAHIPQMGI
jgi:integrase/recombinase XerD